MKRRGLQGYLWVLGFRALKVYGFRALKVYGFRALKVYGFRVLKAFEFIGLRDSDATSLLLSYQQRVFCHGVPAASCYVAHFETLNPQP